MALDAFVLFRRSLCQPSVDGRRFSVHRLPAHRIFCFMTDVPIASPPPRKKLVLGISAAVAVAAVALVVFILPAEYGVDPTGAGKALGVTKLSEPELNEEQIRGAKRTGVLT